MRISRDAWVRMLKKRKILALAGLAYVVTLMVDPKLALTGAKVFLGYFKEMFEILPMIFALTILTDGWIPKEKITAGVGQNAGLRGAMLSFFLGAVSAGPIYAAFPLTKTLLEKGASLRNGIIILSSWAVIKLPMLINEAKFIGFKYVAVRWVLTIAAIYLMATLMAKGLEGGAAVGVDVGGRKKSLESIPEGGA